jgi:hypothetical protein
VWSLFREIKKIIMAIPRQEWPSIAYRLLVFIPSSHLAGAVLTHKVTCNDSNNVGNWAKQGKKSSNTCRLWSLFNNGHYAGAMLSTDFTISFKSGMGEQGR